MNELRIRTRRRVNITLVITFAAGLILAVAGLAYRTLDSVLLAVLPLSLGIAWWLVRPRELDLVIVADNAESAAAGTVLSVHSLESVRPIGKSYNPNSVLAKRYPLELAHADGVIRIPPHAEPPARELYPALLNLLAPARPKKLPQRLQAHWEAQQDFAADQVLACAARSHLAEPAAHWFAATIALAVTASLWMVISVTDVSKAWGFFPAPASPRWGEFGGVLLVVVAPALFVMARFVEIEPARGLRKWRNVGLVISPRSLALAQGNLCGQMAWDELLEVKLDIRPWKAITLVVSGATITLHDVFDRPIFLIYQRIMKLWKNEEV